jgi:phosphoglycolate phosphatase-like HAD superfamily hydrolase
VLSLPDMKPGRSVMIFDVDGTLIDSNDAHARAWVETLRRFGIDRDTEAARRLVGMGGDKLLPALTGIEATSELGQQIAEQRGEYFRHTYLDRLRPFKDTRALFLELRARGVRLAVASSSDQEDLDRLLEIARVADLIERRASADDAKRTKPDPDVIHAAMSRLGDTEDAAVTMVGDTPYDVEAARRARIRAIGFRCGGWSDADLVGAAEIFDDPADMLAHLDRALAT